MKQKKVLIISPVPSHPQNAGNRARVFHLANALGTIGFEVHFLFTGHEPGDRAAMNSYWEGRIYCFERPLQSGSMLRGLKKLSRFFRYSRDERAYNIPVDDWYANTLDLFIRQLQTNQPFDIVIVEYIFLSKALLNFSPHTLKLIDTHDIFTNRFQLYLTNSQVPQWFSTYRAEEKKALDRADIVIAVQEHEKEFFETVTSKKVIQVGHLLPVRSVERAQFEQKLLFVASPNPINVAGINFFIKQVLRKLTAKYPDMQLIIAGSICRVLDNRQNILLQGEFDDPQVVYDAADIVINPVRFGTGINIKTIEALSFGKPLVATSPATKGLEDGRNRGFLVADTADEFVDAVSALIDHPFRRDMLQRNAAAFMSDYNQRNLSQLEAALTTSTRGFRG